MDHTEPDGEHELGAGWVTIDALAQASAITVRNIRAYQARGLLPPPTVRARTGFYGPEHRSRLELIKDLQGQGLKLDTIRSLFETTGGRTEQVLDFIRAVRQLFAAEPGQIVSTAELAEGFGTADPALLRRAVKAGLLREVGDDQYEDMNPRLTEAGRACVQLGIPLDKMLTVTDQLRRHADAVAKIYVQLFLDEVWKPFDSSGRPDEQWPDVHASMAQLRTVSGDALLALLDVSVSERLDITFGRDITRNVRAAAKRTTATVDDAPGASSS